MIENPHMLVINPDEYEKLEGKEALDKLVDDMKTKAEEVAGDAKHPEHLTHCPVGHNLKMEAGSSKPKYTCQECQGSLVLPRNTDHKCLGSDNVRTRCIVDNTFQGFYYKLPEDESKESGETELKGE